MVLLEVCVDSVAGVLASAQGGASRVELCSALSEGGVTPSHGLIQQAVAAAAAARLPVHVLIRPRGGDFLYTEHELLVMEEDISHAARLGAAGVVVGALSPDGTIDMPCTSRMVQVARSQGLDVTFHRAFDMCRDLSAALEQLVQLGIPRVLTSGGSPTALQGAETLRALMSQAAGRIVVMAGSGVTEANVAALVAATGVQEVHSSSRRRQVSGMTYRRPGMSMASTPVDEYAPLVTDVETIRAIVRAAASS